MRNLKRTIQRGFTMVELIIVIVILGILAAAATMGYNSMQKSATQAQLDGLAAQLTSLSAANYGASAVRSNVAGTDFTAVTTDCGDLSGSGPFQLALPAGYTLATDTFAATTSGTPLSCTITGPDSLTAVATIIHT